MLRLLARGAPLTRQHADRALAELGIDQHTARHYLDAWTERNDHDDIVGLGLTYNRTPHRMTIGDAQMWAWCALDTLIFAIVLDRQVAVESTAPGSGETVRLQAGPDGIVVTDSADAVVTWPARTKRPGRHQHHHRDLGHVLPPQLLVPGPLAVAGTGPSGSC